MALSDAPAAGRPTSFLRENERTIKRQRLPLSLINPAINTYLEIANPCRRKLLSFAAVVSRELTKPV
jgi:hypothetical protein